MIPLLRRRFNENFTAKKYHRLLQVMERQCGTPVPFRISETPCFFDKGLLDLMAGYGKELIHQLESPEYRRASEAAIPPEYKVPREAPFPMFIQVDFGLVRGPSGNLEPRLVELQGFPSLYAYQAILSQNYLEVFDLDRNLRYLLGGLEWDGYRQLLRRAVVGSEDPDNVIIMEIDPRQQKTLPDFLLTEKLLGVATVSISDIKKQGQQLFYEKSGKWVPIHRIYNRAIVDELVRKKPKLTFRFDEELKVEWAGHPNWYFRMSKFALPYLRHPCVPRTQFLSQPTMVGGLENSVVKPLFSFAGLGVLMHPRKEDLAAIPAEKRWQYILQERMNFEPVIETPFGKTKAEVRIMYIWVEELLPVMTIVRMGRGLMMGVDHNKDMQWVGSSAALYPSA
ncbi:MAG TPA: hypothetical protein VEK33_08050 [Terriglobales bacterium]|nr:hypothetical protein [Terriglobales bacterium]